MPIHQNQDRAKYQGLFWLSGAVILVASLFLVFLIYLWFADPGEIERAKSWEIEKLLLNLIQTGRIYTQLHLEGFRKGKRKNPLKCIRESTRLFLRKSHSYFL
jgi:hypothetical protein